MSSVVSSSEEKSLVNAFVWQRMLLWIVKLACPNLGVTTTDTHHISSTDQITGEDYHTQISLTSDCVFMTSVDVMTRCR